MTFAIYPLSIREVKPWPLATKIAGVRGDGLPDGFHTGGAWTWDGLVYKPLDGRPHPLAENHVQTEEDVVLEALAGQPLFPKNWWVEERNGRRFLVRKQAVIVGGPIVSWKDLSYDQLIQIERGIMNMNRLGYCVNDAISIGFDPDTCEMFIVDMSIAGQVSPIYWADDMHQVDRMFEWAGMERLRKLRSNARSALHDYLYLSGNVPEYHERIKFNHVYASFYRPIDRLWATLPDDVVLVQNKHENPEESTPYTWLFSHKELGDPLNPDPSSLMYRYELTWGYSRLHPRN